MTPESTLTLPPIAADSPSVSARTTAPRRRAALTETAPRALVGPHARVVVPGQPRHRSLPALAIDARPGEAAPLPGDAVVDVWLGPAHVRCRGWLDAFGPSAVTLLGTDGVDWQAPRLVRVGGRARPVSAHTVVASLLAHTLPLIPTARFSAHLALLRSGSPATTLAAAILSTQICLWRAEFARPAPPRRLAQRYQPLVPIPVDHGASIVLQCGPRRALDVLHLAPRTRVSASDLIGIRLQARRAYAALAARLRAAVSGDDAVPRRYRTVELAR